MTDVNQSQDGKFPNPAVPVSNVEDLQAYIIISRY